MIGRLALLALLTAATPAASEGIAGQFDFYVLSMDWAPRNCPSDDPAAKACQPGDHGFLFHTLWPQSGDSAPTACLTMFPQDVTTQTLASLGDVLPKSLATQEWELHGICAGLKIVDYFALTHKAIARLVIPADFVRPNFAERLTPRQIEDGFVAVNPGLVADDLSVQCSRGSFTGVKLCLSKDLAFHPCDAVRASACEGSSIAIPAIQ